jgi:YesN/AraC family two-component response regulator
VSPIVSRIVVIDARAGLVAMLAVLLEKYCTVEWAATAMTAVQAVDDPAPDLVVVDLGLPGLDVACLADIVKERHPACRLVAVAGPDDDARLQRLATRRLDGAFRRGTDFGRLVCRVIALLSLDVKSPGAGQPFNPYVSRALEHVSANYHRPLTLDGVARSACVSASHLAHLFPDFTDLTLRHYVAKVRVDIARRLLATSEAGLDAVAEQCGFCDAPHLSRVFRRHTGTRPGAYRRSVMRALAARPAERSRSSGHIRARRSLYGAIG